MASIKSLLKYPCVLFVGVPGSGKTTFASAIADYCYKHHIDVYSNTPINYTYQIDKSDIGVNLIDNGVLIFDEAGVDLNSRSYKSMSNEMIKYLKYVRHFHIRSMWFSQDLDMDITIRRLASVIYIVRRSRIPGYITAVPVKCKFDIDENSHDLAKLFFLDPPLKKLFSSIRIRAKKYYKLFDSWSTYPLKDKVYPYLDFVYPVVEKKSIKSILGRLKIKHNK